MSRRVRLSWPTHESSLASGPVAEPGLTVTGILPGTSPVVAAFWPSASSRMGRRGFGGLTAVASLLTGRQHCGVPFVPVNAIDTFNAVLVPGA